MGWIALFFVRGEAGCGGTEWIKVAKYLENWSKCDTFVNVYPNEKHQN